VHLDLWGKANSAVYRGRPRTLELKTAIIALIRKYSQEDLQKAFANKIKWVQTCINTREHKFQYLFKSTQRLSERTAFSFKLSMWR
jgi:hypothetical protein